MTLLDLGTVRCADFAAHVGESFTVAAEDAAGGATAADGDAGGRQQLVLLAAEEWGPAWVRAEVESGTRARMPFRLTFRGRLDQVLPQQIYRLSHEVVGSCEPFVVPVGGDREGMRYEVTFT